MLEIKDDVPIKILPKAFFEIQNVNLKLGIPHNAIVPDVVFVSLSLGLHVIFSINTYLIVSAFSFYGRKTIKTSNKPQKPH
ncbi:hypothetical protein L1887_39209 [Cichorium endivia]|nr:hypothetical protein L1887_39209 [Cichorium endivia]